MKILPTPTPDEIAAILVAIQRATPSIAPVEVRPKASPWRMAGRDYAGDFRR